MKLTPLPRDREGQSLLPKERDLLAATVGIERHRALTRWPLTVAFGPQAWLPGVLGAVVAAVIAVKHAVFFWVDGPSTRRSRVSGRGQRTATLEEAAAVGLTSSISGKEEIVFRFVRLFKGSGLSVKEQTLLAETVGPGRYRVLTRWPLTVAFGPHAWLPALGGGVCGFALSYRHGLGFGLIAASVAGAAQMVSLAAHEAGHLLSTRNAREVSPRMLLMRSSGGVAIVEGRFTEPRGAAAFAAGGPIATVVFTIVLVLAAVLVSPSSVSIGLLVAAFLNSLILAVNLLPVAPTDGYALFRSAVWAETGSRAEAERRALAWSRVVIASGLLVALLVLEVDKLYGVLAVMMLITLTAQHHVVARRAAENPA